MGLLFSICFLLDIFFSSFILVVLIFNFLFLLGLSFNFCCLLRIVFFSYLFNFCFIYNILIIFLDKLLLYLGLNLFSALLLMIIINLLSLIKLRLPKVSRSENRIRHLFHNLSHSWSSNSIVIDWIQHLFFSICLFTIIFLIYPFITKNFNLFSLFANISVSNATSSRPFFLLSFWMSGNCVISVAIKSSRCESRSTSYSM